MPIYEFVCMKCESHFEELVRMDESADCPDCGSTDVRKQLSAFVAHGAGKQLSGAGRAAGGGGCCGGACGC